MRLGIDIDNVVADFTGHLVGTYNHHFATDLKVADWVEYGWIYDAVHFDSPQALWDWSDAVGLWATMPTVPGALGALYSLKQEGHIIELVTSRHEKTRRQTDDWVRQVVPDGVVAGVHFTSKAKHVVPCALYLDDDPAVIDQLNAAKKLTVKFKRPWNTKAKTASGLVVADWPEFLKLVREMNK